MIPNTTVLLTLLLGTAFFQLCYGYWGWEPEPQCTQMFDLCNPSGDPCCDGYTCRPVTRTPKATDEVFCPPGCTPISTHYKKNENYLPARTSSKKKYTRKGNLLYRSKFSNNSILTRGNMFSAKWDRMMPNIVDNQRYGCRRRKTWCHIRQTTTQPTSTRYTKSTEQISSTATTPIWPPPITSSPATGSTGTVWPPPKTSSTRLPPWESTTSTVWPPPKTTSTSTPTWESTTSTVWPPPITTSTSTPTWETTPPTIWPPPPTTSTAMPPGTTTTSTVWPPPTTTEGSTTQTPRVSPFTRTTTTDDPCKHSTPVSTPVPPTCPPVQYYCEFRCVPFKLQNRYVKY